MKRLAIIIFVLSFSQAARADYLGSWKIDDAMTFTAQTSSNTGAATDADAVPAYRVYEDETGTAILTGNMAKLDDTNTTGFYSEQITLSAANGFESGKSYSIYISAAVSSVTGATNHNFQIEAATNATKVSGSGTAADNMEVVYSTDFGTNYDSTADMWNVDVTALGGSATPVTNINTVYNTDFAANYSTAFDKWNVMNAGLITTVSGVNSNTDFDITANIGGTNLVGSLVQLTDGGGTYYGRVDSNGTGSTNVTVTWYNSAPTVDVSDNVAFIRPTSFGTATITSTAVATDAIGSAELASDSIGDAEIATGAIASTAFAAGAIDNAAFNVTETLTANPASGGIVAASFGAGAIDATAIATDAIGDAEVATGAIASTAFASGAIDNTAFNVTETLTANPASGGIAAGSFAAGAIDASAIATGAIGNDEFNVTETLTANPASGGIVAASFGAGAITNTVIASGAIVNGTEATGFPTQVLRTTVATPNTATNFVINGGGDLNDNWNDAVMVIYDDAGGGPVAIRRISDSADSSGNSTITLASSPGFTPDTGDVVEIYPNLEAASGGGGGDVTSIAGSTDAAAQLAEAFDNDGTGGDLDLTSLTVVNSGGSAVTITSSGSNGHGVVIAGNGTGEGISSTGGASGHGAEFVGGSSAGNGVYMRSPAAYGLELAATTLHGLYSHGGGDGKGALLVGGATGVGLGVTGGGTSGTGIEVSTSDGHGFAVTATGSSKHGMLITGGTGGTSDALKLVAGTGGVAFRLGSTEMAAQTGDSFARLGAPAGASVSADIAAIEGQTDDLGAAGAGLSAIPWNAAWDAEVESEVDDSLSSAEILLTAEALTDIDDTIEDESIQTKTNFLPSATAGTAGGVLIAGSNAATTFSTLTSTGAFSINGVSNVAQTGDSFNRIGAPAGASMSADIAAIEGQTDDIGAAGAGLTAIDLPDQTMNITGNLSGSIGSLGAQAKLDVNAEADTALSDIHLDHLLATTYDPAAKPGVADALLNELVENDGSGVSRYSPTALETAPTGGGASADVIADAVWDEVRTGHTDPDSFGLYLDDEVSDAVEAAGSAGAGATDVNIEAVPTSRTFVLVRRTEGLVGEASKTIEADVESTYAVDFRNDAATNQKIFRVTDIELASGSMGGLTFSDQEDDWGKEGTLAKFRLTGVSAGTYKLRVSVQYQSSAGPEASGVITLVVVE